LAEKIVTFRCLRCEHEYEGPYDSAKPVERSCPQCHSNSVRPLPAKKEA